MRKLLCLILISLSACAGLQKQPQQRAEGEVYLFSYFKGNGDGLHLAYSLDGYNWQALKQDSIFVKPTAGNDKLMRDPCIIRGGDGRFHMVWTVSWNEKGIGYASSPDLLHWSEQQFIPVMAHEPEARNTWAPEITYDARTKEYMIYWASTVTGLYPETQSTADNGYNHRMYYTTTRDFARFSDTKLLYEPGFNVIDATIVPEGDRYVMFLKDETREPAAKNLRIAYADHLTGPYSPASPAITGKYWAEGPTTLKVNDKWLVYFDKYTEHSMGAVQSENLKDWEDISAQISFPKGMRHGTIFTVTRAEFEKLQ
ncbi:glycoside hydrolase family 43 protein [Pontibacter sp. E15-1]|uniref:glycoside hydrolase family 43 protein n=1 Tax=Pontibacter sp. E15-1 TaxID=2919918 RepID=UPI001F50222E|nr:glycoside hydrolase family 43 protein [Pontibacter sp. E15-1]MCJ8165941.1 glycoside hydrolase family 43 protein [Pontibacter sp. E15-1]